MLPPSSSCECTQLALSTYGHITRKYDLHKIPENPPKERCLGWQGFLYQFEVPADLDGFCPSLRVQLREHLRNMGLHGVLRDRQVIRDLQIGQPICHEIQHVEFLLAEHGPIRIRLRFATTPPRRVRREYELVHEESDQEEQAPRHHNQDVIGCPSGGQRQLVQLKQKEDGYREPSEDEDRPFHFAVLGLSSQVGASGRSATAGLVLGFNDVARNSPVTGSRLIATHTPSPNRRARVAWVSTAPGPNTRLGHLPADLPTTLPTTTPLCLSWI